MGYMYVYATYANGDVHEVNPSQLNVTVYETTKVDYSLVVIGNASRSCRMLCLIALALA